MAPFSRLSQALLATLLTTPDCSVQGDSLQCRLLSILHYLYVAGAVLAVIFLVVLIVAIRAWLSSRNSDDIPTKDSSTRKHPRA
ncbi:hypothetical protein GOB94_02490 [Granulicella sp. 5B5]|uniref:hypothetical protein n=1 Tax=Granulicella sp. 5B5 TaxID=1617967 RepID=UPI0015F62927|nr:hypothetical protein [Granulicella sp. 5B5]QMV17692.1 hypothetical protein GOB94_02490 [Granulicella sp. 5B5]